MGFMNFNGNSNGYNGMGKPVRKKATAKKVPVSSKSYSDMNKKEQNLYKQQVGRKGELDLSHLIKLIPFGTVIRNVYIKNKQGQPVTEIDMILVHTTGIYVFEMKNHTGFFDNVSNSSYWNKYYTYFDKSVNQTVFKPVGKIYSPVLQNMGHIKSLRGLFEEKGLPTNVPIFSYVVFGHNARLRTEYADSFLKIVTLDDVYPILSCDISSRPFLITNDYYTSFVKLFNSCARVSKADKENHIKIAKAIAAKNGSSY